MKKRGFVNAGSTPRRRLPTSPRTG